MLIYLPTKWHNIFYLLFGRMKLFKVFLFGILPALTLGMGVYGPDGHHRACKKEIRCSPSKFNYNNV